jgi:hypothetical protein
MYVPTEPFHIKGKRAKFQSWQSASRRRPLLFQAALGNIQHHNAAQKFTQSHQAALGEPNDAILDANFAKKSRTNY